MKQSTVEEVVAQVEIGRSLWIGLEVQGPLSIREGATVRDPHLTIVHLGKGCSEGLVQAIDGNLAELDVPPMTIRCHGVARWRGKEADGGDFVVALVNDSRLHRVRELVTPMEFDRRGSWTPHVTLHRTPCDDALSIPPLINYPQIFVVEYLILVCGDARRRYPLRLKVD